MVVVASYEERWKAGFSLRTQINPSLDPEELWPQHSSVVESGVRSISTAGARHFLQHSLLPLSSSSLTTLPPN